MYEFIRMLTYDAFQMLVWKLPKHNPGEIIENLSPEKRELLQNAKFSDFDDDMMAKTILRDR